MSSGSDSCSPSQRRKMFCNTSYKDLQIIARKHSIPCNLKKDLLRTLILAKIEGRDGEVEFLLKQDREMKRRRKLRREEERSANLWYMHYYGQNRNVVTAEELQSERRQVEKDDPQLSVKVKEVLKQMIDQSSCRNVTICKTQMEAHYRAYVNPVSSLNFTAGGHSNATHPFEPYKPQPVLNSGFYPSNPGPAVWQTPPVVNEGATASTYTIPSQHNFVSLCEKHSPPSANQLVPYHPRGSSGLDPPPFIIRNLSYCQSIKPAKPENMPSSISLDPYLLRQNNVVSTCSGTLNEFQPKSSDNHTSVTVDFQNPTLPLFGTVFKKNMSGVSAAPKPDSATQFQNDSTGLVCLAETALCMSQQGEEELRWPYKEENHVNTDHNKEIIEVASGTTKQEIPTWKNLLESMPSSTKIFCKFGCHIPMQSRDDQLSHETNCLLQPIPCPLLNCNWFSQIRFISTHIFKDHMASIIVGAESSFAISFGLEESNSFNSPVTPGPNRLCFIQLFNKRLFAIFVIANFQSMQMSVYIQYVNDTALWKAMVAFEVCRADGLPYQWSGHVYPLSHSSMHLITRRECLIFNMDNENFVNKAFTLNTKLYQY